MAAREEHRTVELREIEQLRASVDALATEVEQAKDEGAFKSVYGKIKELISTFIARHRSEQSTADTTALRTEITELDAEKARVETTIRAIQERERAAQGQYEALKSQIEKQKEGSLEAEKLILHIMTEQGTHNVTLSRIRASEDRILSDEQNLKRDVHEIGLLLGRDVLNYAEETIVDESGQAFSHEALSAHVVAEDRTQQMERRRVLEKLKIRLEEFGGGSGDDVLKEYRETEERDAFLAREVIDLESSATSLVKLIDELKQKLDEEFNRGILKINTEFQNFFALMFGGGNAQLKLVREERKKKRSLGSLLGVGGDDEGDASTDDDTPERAEDEVLPFGIDISVSLPNKRVQGLAMLSGGERALTSIALLFAMSQVNPPPFIILDETDAALDEANSRKYGDMIENLARFSQLILITHNRETMSRAGVLYGVTMGNEGASKLLSIQFEEAVKVAK
jgi:chromosome segregation protein